jgi:hypothetical protein
VGDWIYYVNWSYLTDVCRIKTDGSNRQILYDGQYQCLTTDGHNQYFGKQAGPGTSLLYRASLDGRSIKQLTVDTIDHFFAYGDWIYYMSHFSSLCRINKNTLKKQTLFSDENFIADAIIPVDDKLYLAGDAGIRVLNIRTRKVKVLYKTRVIEFGLASNYVYFTRATWDKNNERHTHTYLMPLSKLEKVNQQKNR